MMALAALVAACVVAAYVYQDGVHASQDGTRYTSGKLQPSPFNRRFCAWPPRLLAAVTWGSFVAIAASFGTWQQALLFVTLPGVWFCSMHPTTVDAPAMLLAWGSALLYPAHPYVAVLLSLLGGLVHERAPVFAAAYALSPWLLLGLVGPLLVAKLRGAAKPDYSSADLADHLVGHGSTWKAAKAHRPHVDLLNDTGLVWALRGLVPLAAWLGAGPAAWLALALAYGSRLVGTDTARAMLWAAPPLVAGSHAAPVWAVALHVMSFKRVAR